MTKPRTVIEVLGNAVRAGTRPAPAVKQPPPQTLTAPRMPVASDLTREDLARVCAVAGFAMPAVEGMAPVESPAFVERSRRLANGYLEARRAYEQAQHEVRSAEVTAGAIDARTASPEAVRARVAGLGLGDADALRFHDVGRPLEAPITHEASRTAVHERDAAREVARHVHRAMQAGQPVDARRLSPAEVRELLALRGG